MLAEDGAAIEVAGGHRCRHARAGQPRPRRPTDAPVAFHPRHRVRLGAGAALTLIEISIGEGVYLHNPVLEAEVGEGATLTHLRLQDEARRAFHLVHRLCRRRGARAPTTASR